MLLMLFCTGEIRFAGLDEYDILIVRLSVPGWENPNRICHRAISHDIL